MVETKEEFIARYPKPSPRRILVKCCCDYKGCTGWAWSMEPLAVYETKVEEPSA